MSKIAIVTDSNSGITQDEAKGLGISVVPMPFFINGEQYLEGVTLSKAEFYSRQEAGDDITTSQPSAGEVIDLWDGLLKEYDEIVHMPTSKSLSGSYETAVMLAKEYDGKVKVVDTKRISITLRQCVLDAIELKDRGTGAAEIQETIEKHNLDASIYVTVDTLKYLKKGGRVTPAAAAIGTVLNLKPVLKLEGEKLDAYAKVRGWKQAKKTMLDAMDRDMVHKFENQKVHLYAAYNGSEEEAMEWKDEIEVRFPKYKVTVDTLALCIGCHIGPGALAIACSKFI